MGMAQCGHCRLFDYLTYSDSENGFAGFGATLDLNHIGVFARLHIFAGTFNGINEFINIV